MGGLQRCKLHDVTAHREPEQVQLRKAERFEEGEQVISHGSNVDRYLAGRETNAGIVEQNHLALARKAVDDCGIPIVQRSTEAMAEGDGRPAWLSESAVGVAHAAGFDVLGLRRFMGDTG